jgi:adenine-specific DNA-methyltransferase
MKIKTVAYKGSKRKMLEDIEFYAKEVGAKTFFDGFSGTGIVSAFMRSKGYQVEANDLNYSSYIYGSVFLHGFNPSVVDHHLDVMNNSLTPLPGWLTSNYSGTRERLVRGTGGSIEERPLGYTANNARILDAAREYVESITPISVNDRNALTFSVVLAADRVFNNSNDQKSALKEWSKASLAIPTFVSPTLISGPVGTQHVGDILNVAVKSDVAYYDPPYTHGVLYASCYHLNDSISKWDKPSLDDSYAIPRPESVCFRKNKQKAGGFYNKESAISAFRTILNNSDCKRLIFSYSDAPRNTLSIQELVSICSERGNVKVVSRKHKICTQPKQMKKVSEQLKEFFIIIDT